MFTPPHCPNPDCAHRYRPPEDRWYTFFGHYETKAFKTVPRFRCKNCRKTFSSQTFSIDYAVKYVIDYRPIFQQVNSSAGLTSAAAVKVTGASHTPAAALAYKTHHWQVRALDSRKPVAQTGEWSAVSTLDVDDGRPPGGLRPADGSKTTDTTPDFWWSTVAGAVSYEIRIAETSAELANAAVVKVTENSYTPTVALACKTHYWRVRALKGGEVAGPWSGVTRLEVRVETPGGLKPATGSTTANTAPAFSWTAVAGATGCEIQIADTEAGLADAAANKVQTNSCTPATALNYTTHCWQVRALPNGEWSARHSISVFDDRYVRVEGGTFKMGSPSGGSSDERPVRDVTLSSFQMSPYEVTQKEYKAVMGNNPSYFGGTVREKHPVEGVSWYNAVRYANALSIKRGLEEVYTITEKFTAYNNKKVEVSTAAADWTKNGYRLPTEAEWEYAARGGASSKRYAYSGSNNPKEVAWHEDNSGNATHPVGSMNANELGLYDMSGNVYEWCWDWHGSCTWAAQTNPKGPKSGSDVRVRRD